MIAGSAKAFCIPIEHVLYDMSYANVVLYGATLPSYDNLKKDKKDSRLDRHGKPQEVIKADDPRNNDRVSQFLDSIQD